MKKWIEDKAAEEEKKILHFTALGDGGAGISLVKSGSPDPISLEYKVNSGEWSSWDRSDVQLQKDDVMYVRAVDENKTFSKDYSNFYYFSMSGGKVAAGGSIQYLLKKNGNIDSVLTYGFYRLFFGSNLTQAPELPATTLADKSYSYMFFNCTSLIQAPELPATTLASYCYDSMFYNCSNLTQAPKLPATTLANQCYSYMFYNCTSLTQAPELLATTLANYCYYFMFRNCNKISEVHMPASMDGVYNKSTHGDTYKTVVYDL